MEILRAETFGLTHVGGRNNNEDAYNIFLNQKLLLVADGMGGHHKGEIASAAATASIAEDVTTAVRFNSTADAKVWMCSSLQKAHRTICGLNHDASGRNRMGTTATLALIEGTSLLVAWAGDSRVYLLHNGELDLVNDDHVYDYEQWCLGRLSDDAWASRRRGYTSNEITRCLGTNRTFEIDVRETAITAGDVVLTCSDGLNDSLIDSQIIAILSHQGSAKQIAEDLINAALYAGANDNVTVVVSKIHKQNQ